MKDLERPVEKRLNRDNGLVLALLLLGFTCSLFAAAVALELMMRRYWSVGEWLLLLAGCVVEGALILSIVRPFRHRRLPQDLGRLHRQIESIRAGDLSKPLDLPEDADLRKTAEALNDIQSGMKSALEEQTRSERMKVELISNVSHDLKTPLTSILSYAELLRQEELPPAAADYARIIGEKARRLGTMVQDVFEVSKAAADQLPETILFYNGGASITCEDSPALEDLRSLEAQGVEILTCGTCLNFYGLTDKLQVGGVTNMYTIVEKMTGAGLLVKP